MGARGRAWVARSRGWVVARSDRVVVTGLVMIAAQLAYRWWALSGSWFYFDDLAFLSRAQTQPLDAAYLTESYGGHLMPGAFWVIWWLTHWFPFEWTPWALVLIVLQALASVGMLRLLLSAFGHRRAVLPLLGGYLLLVTTLPAFIWFAAGINQLPLQIALAFGLTSHLAYLRTRRSRHLVATLAWTGFGLLFYEKTLILFGVYAAVALGWFCTRAALDRPREVWDRYRTGVLAHALVASAYLVLYVQHGLDWETEKAATIPWTPVLFNLVAVAFASASIGGPFQWRDVAVGSIADPSQLVMLVSWIALGYLVWYARSTRTRSQRAWLVVGYALLLDVALVVTGRAVIVGPDIALEYRYQSETSALLMLSVGLALLPLVGAREVNEVRLDQPRPYEQPRRVTAVAVAVAVAALVSSQSFVDAWWTNNPTPDFIANVEHSLETAPRTPVPMVDAGLPLTLMWAYRYPENTYSHVLKPYADQMDFVSASLDNLYMFDDLGHLAPVLVSDTRTALPGPVPGCGYRLGRGDVDVPLDGPVVGTNWWARIGYAAPGPAQVRITAGDRVHTVDLEEGLHNLFVLADGEFDHLRIERVDGGRTGVCLTDVVVGVPSPVVAP